MKDFISSHEARIPALTELSSYLQSRLETLVRESGVRVHSLSSRIKTTPSLRKKLARPDKTYGKLDDITDTIGFRIITYIEDSVEQIASLIETHFKLDFDRCIDRRKTADPTQFGYRSLHYVCRLSEEFPHSKALPEFRFEIQVRTILQHAWAEIEHDLGYKSSDSIPKNVRRQFARVASLLEMADEQFVDVHTRLAEYQKEIERNHATSLDKISLRLLVHRESLASLDRELAKRLNRSLSEELFFPEYLVKMLSLVGLSSVDDIERAAKANEAEILGLVDTYFAFAEKAFGLARDQIETVQRGYGVLFLAHHHILTTGSLLDISKLERLTEFYRALDYPDDSVSAKRVATLLIHEITKR